MQGAMLPKANTACMKFMFLLETQPLRVVSQSCDVSNAISVRRNH
jgi:hypothetical protein